MSDTSVKFWGVMAPTYDSAVDDSIGKNLRPAVLGRLARETSLGRVVEFGCGTGFFTAALARAAESVTATDFCDEMLAIAADRLKGVPNVTLRNEDCMKPSLPDATFDTAFMSLVLNLTDDPAQAIEQVHRVLKPGGTLMVAIPDWGMMDSESLARNGYRMKVNYDEAQSQYPITGKAISDTDLEALLGNAGFRIVSFEVFKDVAEVSGSAIDFVKAVKSCAVSSATVPRTVIEVGGTGKVIEVKHLTHKYGRFLAVYNVSFSVSKGEVFALLGPNGAGKSTIVEILECLKMPVQGFVSILGDAMLTGVEEGNVLMGMDRDYRGIKEKIGVLPQSFNAFDLLTVRENLDYFARMYEKHVDIDGLIEEFRLVEKRNVLFRNLSGGLKQRVGIAIALVNDPEVVFLDEPSAGLDPRSRRDVWDAIRSLKARGKTVVLTTHYMDEAQHLADHVCIMHKGTIVAEGTPDELINRYGGGSTLIVRDCSPGGMEHLIAAIPGGRVEGRDFSALLPCEDSMTGLSQAIDVLKSGRFSCKEIYVRKPSLDDVFMNLTGEKLAGEVS